MATAKLLKGALSQLRKMQREQDALAAAEKVAEEVAKGRFAGQHTEGLKVYHGSPHEFDVFNFEPNLKRGEGNLAYGPGGYLTGNKSLAQEYARKLSSVFVPELSGFKKLRSNLNTANSFIRGEPRSNYRVTTSYARPSFDLKTALGPNGEPSGPEYLRTAIAKDPAAAAQYLRYGFVSNANPEMYKAFKGDTEVRANDDFAEYLASVPRIDRLTRSDHVIDAGRTLARELERKNLTHLRPNIVLPINPRVRNLYETTLRASPDDLLPYDYPLEEVASPRVLGALSQLAEKYKFGIDGSTGADVVRTLDRASGMSPKEQMRILREAGLPGLYYLRGGRRNQVDIPSEFNPDDYNFVVFDDKILDPPKRTKFNQGGSAT